MNQDTDPRIKLLQAGETRLKQIDKILEGKHEPAPPMMAGPLLLGMGAAAKMLRVSQATLWHTVRYGILLVSIVTLLCGCCVTGKVSIKGSYDYEGVVTEVDLAVTPSEES